MKKRITTALLLISMLASVACGGTSGGESVDTTAASGEVETTTPVETEIPDDLPETDLEGYEFRILGFGDERFAAIWVEELNGSLVNDAVYDKCKAVEDRFNCKIILAEGSTVGGTANTAEEKDKIQKPILAGDDSFDIASGHDITVANLTLEGIFVNMYKVPHLNFDKPWWPKYTVESLTFDDQMYMFSNSLSYNNLGDTRVMYFNKSLLTEMGIEHPYQTVYDGKWTLDALNAITKKGYRDLNGDSKQDVHDQYGIVNPTNYYGVLEPFNLEPYAKTDDGELVYKFNLDKYQSIAEKFYSLFVGDGGKLIATDSELTADDIFANGNSMFIYRSLGTAVRKFAFSDTQYGILPMPKLNESDEIYYGGCTDRPCVVPITANSHLDETGLIIEALSAEGYRKVFPAYFEQALKVRYADDNDDAKMIDLVTQNVILSFTYMYGNYKSPYNNMLETLFKLGEENTNVSSYAESIRTAQEERVKVIMEAYRDMKNG